MLPEELEKILSDIEKITSDIEAELDRIDKRIKRHNKFVIVSGILIVLVSLILFVFQTWS